MNKIEFSNRLRAIMEKNDITPKALCEKTQLEKAHLSHIMSGDRAPSIGTLSKIIQALPKTTDVFFLITGTERKGK